ncbi:hypothetical protein OBBRIDRAFT_1343 [Obba rivulosa]|uniref:Uncharacterized protein n=1 Tax=Obba rivulosa TaxID=1052685 RepID=A0A8E2J7E7_9APHY|nr:hypothetical protein OBBRIDRAFT_1343 [Obba rivulosa]
MRQEQAARTRSQKTGVAATARRNSSLNKTKYETTAGIEHASSLIYLCNPPPQEQGPLHPVWPSVHYSSTIPHLSGPWADLPQHFETFCPDSGPGERPGEGRPCPDGRPPYSRNIPGSSLALASHLPVSRVHSQLFRDHFKHLSVNVGTCPKRPQTRQPQWTAVLGE